MKEFIYLKGVCQNNLKSLDVKIPLNCFTVLCGPSGSGKSSLAFETLYAEGQRRYIESLSNYTKQFLNKAPKPLLESVENIPPSLALTQKNSVKSSRSTIGTYTEILDDLRAFYEKLAKPLCPEHKRNLEAYDPVKGVEGIINVFKNKRGYFLAEVDLKTCVLKKEELLKHLIKEGFLRIYIPYGKSEKVKFEENFSQCSLGEVVLIEDIKKLPQKKFFVVVDRTVFKEDEKVRLIDSLRQTYKLFRSLHTQVFQERAVILTTEGERLLLSTKPSCCLCGFQFPKITSHLFSFNHPQGACPTCEGFGYILDLSERKVIPDPKLTLNQGAIKPFSMPSGVMFKKMTEKICYLNGIDLNQPWNKLPQEHRNIVWKGCIGFKGVCGYFKDLERKKYKMYIRILLSRFKDEVLCPNCKGVRINEKARQVLFRRKSISDICSLNLEELLMFFKNLKLSQFEKECVQSLYEHILFKLQYLNDVGLSYLTLDRNTRTLSGGEFQRINLSRQLGSGLSETLYVLDEPTVGLHPKDTDRLIQILKSLQSSDNTLVIVEHDSDVISSSQFVLEMGPRSGDQGGELMFSGKFKDFLKDKDSPTAKYLSSENKFRLSSFHIPRKKDSKNSLILKGCKGHNLKNIDFKIPLESFIVVTGVSGSGKSSLVTQTLYPALLNEIEKKYIHGLEFESLIGAQPLKDVVLIDQNSITKTERSCPASYLDFYSLIRNIMAYSLQGRLHGMTPRHFSLNVNQGRCPFCQGLGVEIIDMVFMEDVELPCEACGGKKFKDEVLNVRYKNKTILDILNMKVSEAKTFFKEEPAIVRACETLEQVGLSYISLGQRSSTFSSGEAQRLKLAQKLHKSVSQNTMFVIDEPTKGLHFQEVGLLLKVLHSLVEAGASVVVIEHNLEVIASADHIIDLGPGGGPKGGAIVGQGPPFEFREEIQTETARYLRKYFS